MSDDPELKQVFKDLLLKLNDNFADNLNESVYKNVARMERKTTAFIEKLSDPDKFKFNVRHYWFEIYSFILIYFFVYRVNCAKFWTLSTKMQRTKIQTALLNNRTNYMIN